MEITSIKELIKYRNTILKRLEKELAYLKSIENKPFHNKEKEKAKEKVQNLMDILDNIRSFLRETATFKTEEFAPFMRDFLVLTEGDYKLTSIVLLDDYDNDKGSLFKKYSRRNYENQTRSLNGHRVYFISDEATSEFLTRKIFNEHDLNKYLLFSRTDDVTLFDRSTYHPFNKNFSVKDEIARHPRLKTAIYELIQLKMDNADITDKERFNIVLENTVMRNYKRSNK